MGIFMVGQSKLNKSNFYYKNLFLNNYWAKKSLVFFMFTFNH